MKITFGKILLIIGILIFLYGISQFIRLNLIQGDGGLGDYAYFMAGLICVILGILISIIGGYFHCKST